MTTSKAPDTRTTVTVQYACPRGKLPTAQSVRAVTDFFFDVLGLTGEVTVRFVTADESRQLNGNYRDKQEPTNVLAFPLGRDQSHVVGDLVLCRDLLLAEADQQSKLARDHCVHLIMHGLLHLAGWDHQTDDDAEKMEAVEVDLLSGLGVADPY